MRKTLALPRTPRYSISQTFSKWQTLRDPITGESPPSCYFKTFRLQQNASLPPHLYTNTPASISSEKITSIPNSKRHHVTHTPNTFTPPHGVRRRLRRQPLPRHRVHRSRLPRRKRRASAPREMLVRLCHLAVHPHRLDRACAQGFAVCPRGDVCGRLRAGETAVVCVCVVP